ncbi:cell division protein kinase, putative [Entamoeba invadens IP1]|uniref:cyclin-dependent kinase n=1 Tax=Entamoeba invadens IP1 TaxID=370355 RepID=A0A0A1TZM0_ENTIV|nr:cell division protein kinase, putative [Entamoeba invadens IP1]ELP87045.1 cell division protein kinase, putative [Entamoeba invadens IP1]|eukprot:XP_004253816.1 cell division protein kinase, putative [Entamoeba invadens IP1]
MYSLTFGIEKVGKTEAKNPQICRNSLGEKLQKQKEMFTKTRSIPQRYGLECDNRYRVLEVLGEGTYGIVKKVQDVQQQGNKGIYALKVIKPDNSDGISSTSIREVCALKLLRHPNIVQLISVYNRVDKLSMVFEYCETDLAKYLRSKVFITVPEQIRIMKQLLMALEYLHARRFLHRDLKPQNILLTRDGVVKLADFGLVRAVTLPVREYTLEIITLWYRPLEILLGKEVYTSAVDIWSLGAIYAEIGFGHPVFRGESEYDQAIKILEVMGMPDPDEWPEFNTLKSSLKPLPPRFKKVDFETTFQFVGSAGVKLLRQMLRLNPDERISAKDALEDPMFMSFP